jgi:hypothetical protein
MIFNAASEGFGRIRAQPDNFFGHAADPSPERSADPIDRIADAELQDRALLRMVLSAALATALLALAGGLVA